MQTGSKECATRYMVYNYSLPLILKAFLLTFVPVLRTGPVISPVAIIVINLKKSQSRELRYEMDK